MFFRLGTYSVSVQIHEPICVRALPSTSAVRVQNQNLFIVKYNEIWVAALRISAIKMYKMVYFFSQILYQCISNKSAQEGGNS